MSVRSKLLVVMAVLLSSTNAQPQAPESACEEAEGLQPPFRTADTNVGGQWFKDDVLSVTMSEPENVAPGDMILRLTPSFDILATAPFPGTVSYRFTEDISSTVNITYEGAIFLENSVLMEFHCENIPLASNPVPSFNKIGLIVLICLMGGMAVFMRRQFQ